jgi:hypothetical protein
MKKLFSVMVALTMMASLLVTTVSAAPAALLTPTAELGQLKVCKVAGAGVEVGTPFTFKVNGKTYNVPAGPSDRNGYCILAGQFPVGNEVTVEEVILSGYYVSRIEVKPDRAVSKNTSQGIVTVRIVSGVIEAIFTNKVLGLPTSTATSTPGPTKTATSTPSCAPNCTPTSTPVPMGRLQICKEAEGPGVAGSFTFQFETRSRSVPVGACAGLIVVEVGRLTITETAQAGYSVADIYTIPADRLISKDLSRGVATVRIVEGTAISQTIVIFRNRSTTTTSTATATPTATGSQTATSTATPTGSATPTFTATGTGTPTGSATPTFTATSTGSVTPTFTATPTGSATATPTTTGTPVCSPTTVDVDFSQIDQGESVEGMGAVAPYLDINSVSGTAVKIIAGDPNFQYLAGQPPTENGGLASGGGFGDPSGRTSNLPEYIYEFTFANGFTVTEFTVRMLDFGDFNPRSASNHSIVLTAYNAAGVAVGTQDLIYTTDPERLPDNSPEWGNMQIHGDALLAQDGDPGRWTWRVTGDAIAKVVLRFDGVGFDPNFGFDSLSYTTEICPVCQPVDNTALNQLAPGTPIERYGIFAPFLKINAIGTAEKIQQETDPFQYRAGNPAIDNGGLLNGVGFGDTRTRQARQAHHYEFIFGLGITVSQFSVRMLDFGDLNPGQSTNHDVTMMAFNAAGDMISIRDLTYTTEPELLPDNSPQWGNLQLAGDALLAQDGQPGRWTWTITGDQIARVVLHFGEGHDPNIGLDSLSYACQ